MKQITWRSILLNASIFLTGLVVFLAYFRAQLATPIWGEVAGRLHPMAVHFPVVLVLFFTVLAVYSYFAKNQQKAALSEDFLLLSCFFSAISALSGLFLSREGGYEPAAIEQHFVGGIALTPFLLVLYVLKKWLLTGISGLICAVGASAWMILTAHFGGNLTHGADFLTAPLEKNRRSEVTEDTPVFEALVQPIFEKKCISCHNAQKAKGQLVLETKAGIEKGGKNGSLFDAQNRLLERIHLPLNAKEHMPPEAKPQLTPQEMLVMEEWVKQGANFELKISALATDNPLHPLALALLSAKPDVVYHFPFADAQTIAQLNNPNRIVIQNSRQSPALSAAFFNPDLFESRHLAELNAVSEQLVELSAARLPLTDADFQTIAGFETLRKLVLTQTPITGKNLDFLAKLPQLNCISLAETVLTGNDLRVLAKFPSLKTAFVWNTAATSPELEKLKAEFKNIHWETGFQGDSSVLKLSAPVLKNEETVLLDSAVLDVKHYIKGVDIRYTTDGSVPDSILSRPYKPGIAIRETSHFRIKAFKEGWVSSDVLDAVFFKNTVKIDSLILLKPVDKQYAAQGARSFYDLHKGEVNFRSPEWLGYRENPMEVLIPFNSPQTVSRVTLSNLVDIGSFIMPPQQIAVWGGPDAQHLRLLGKTNPQQPEKSVAAYLSQADCSFPPVAVRCLKLVAVNVGKLPDWHPGKGEKGWFFVDEIFLN